MARSTKILALVSAALFLFTAGSGLPQARWQRPGLHRATLEHDGRRREFFVRIPWAWKPGDRWPLLIALHGGGGSGRGMGNFTGFDRLAGREQFVAVYPSGVAGHWNDGREPALYRTHRENVDDVGFLTGLADHVAGELGLDRDRTYLVGISNGAFMTQRIASEQSGAFTAVASVIAAFPKPVFERAAPTEALPVLLMGGTEDRLIPFEGGMARFQDKQLGETIGFVETARFWAGHNGCPADPVEDRLLPDVAPGDGTRVRLRRWGPGRAPVVLYEIEGGGHTWPGGGSLFEGLVSPWIGRDSRDIEASEVIWQFFASASSREE